MKIKVGSTNPTKLEAVRVALQEYSAFRDAQIDGYPAQSRVSEQPQTLEETIRGARNRAIGAHFMNDGYDYYFGIESGLMYVPYGTRMDFCCVAIYNGLDDPFMGLSPAWSMPPAILKLVEERNYDLNQAFFEHGLTKDPKLGNSEGVINILTNGRMNRRDYTILAIKMAMIHIENDHLFK
jgi:inosine/xanthosine triphosphatase